MFTIAKSTKTNSENVAVILDARMGDFYLGLYDTANNKIVSEGVYKLKGIMNGSIGDFTDTRQEVEQLIKPQPAIILHRLRVLIYENSEHLEMFTGEIEVDESYFGGTRKGKRGRGAGGKVPVFGLLKRNGEVYTCNHSRC